VQINDLKKANSSCTKFSRRMRICVWVSVVYEGSEFAGDTAVAAAQGSINVVVPPHPQMPTIQTPMIAFHSHATV
jgi:hypothetical protein